MKHRLALRPFDQRRWRLGGGRDAIGRTLKSAQRAYAIVGVLPPEFRFPPATDVWTPW